MFPSAQGTGLGYRQARAQPGRQHMLLTILWIPWITSPAQILALHFIQAGPLLAGVTPEACKESPLLWPRQHLRQHL